ncbi:MAG: hypothetical protein KDB00_14235, partial [Planctomycetales bacterium]|nr:hypothetical protein [Planctomycetales bacterium]
MKRQKHFGGAVRKSESWRRQFATTRRRKAKLEELENRFLLASTAEIASQLAPHTLTSATVITHGWQMLQQSNDSQLVAGDALMPLAQAIRIRSDLENGLDASSWLLDYDVDGQLVGSFDTASSVLPGMGTSGESGSLVVLFDWASGANRLGTGWVEAAGEALFTQLIDLGLVDPTNPTGTIPLHFIGHGLGAAVTSEAIALCANMSE